MKAARLGRGLTRLKELREKKEMSQRELAKIIQLSPSTVAMYELNRRSLDNDTIIKLANFFNCSTDYLLGKSETYSFIIDETSHSKLPILSTVHFDLPLLAEVNIEGYLDVPELMAGDFAFKFSGDSMTGVGIWDGDYSICRQVETANSGGIVLVLNDLGSGGTEATLRFYCSNEISADKLPLLRAANPNYPEISIQDGHRIVGIMVGLLRKQVPDYQTFIGNPVSVDGKKRELIQKASQYGLTSNQLKTIIDLQWQIFKEIL
jgi:repressor LexA